jgi:hypothetical protein
MRIIRFGERDCVPGFNLIEVKGALEQNVVTQQLQAVLGGTQQSAPATIEIDGTHMTLTTDLQRALRGELGELSPVVDTPPTGGSADEHPAAVSVRAGIAILDALAHEQAELRVEDPRSLSRHRQLTSELHGGADAVVDDLERQRAELKHDHGALDEWLAGIYRGFAQIDAAHHEMVELEAASQRRLAGPSAFNKYLDAKQHRNEVAKSVGFSDYETYVKSGPDVVANARTSMAELEASLAAIDKKIISADSGHSASDFAELDILNLYITFSERLSTVARSMGADGSEIRSRHLMVHSTRRSMATMLKGLGVAPITDERAAAEQWLASAVKAAPAGPSRLAIDLSIRGRMSSLATVPTVGPVPCVVVNAFAGLSASDAQASAAALVASTVGGHQVFYVCTASEAERLHLLN